MLVSGTQMVGHPDILGRFWPSEGGRWQPLTTADDHEGAADSRALVACLPS